MPQINPIGYNLWVFLKYGGFDSFGSGQVWLEPEGQPSPFFSCLPQASFVSHGFRAAATFSAVSSQETVELCPRCASTAARYKAWGPKNKDKQMKSEVKLDTARLETF